MVLMWIPFLFGGNDHLEGVTRNQLGSASQDDFSIASFLFCRVLHVNWRYAQRILRVITWEDKARPHEAAVRYKFNRGADERNVRDEGQSN